ncbi:unnamed protein product [Adineta ricciae]|uniref:Vps16 C-terminal domain-containing protein n=1 Tax=Adineta ricciae TaxID=249248 RepID=A0A813RQ55_ADIRI|nr:unnamed protein product [Adineta ricciae]CAF1104523.1 unnamed protein product [Adineta ricciae]
MDNQAPKPMKKGHRNLLHKVGKKLEKFEQSLGLQSPNLSHGFASASDLSVHSHRSDVNDADDQSDTYSVQYEHSDASPRAVLHHKHTSSISSDGSRLSAQWQANNDEFEPIAKESSSQYDKQMKSLCQDLLEDKYVNFYECREYDKKISLLRMAVSFNTPRITVPVILYLENTLSKPIFYELLKQHPSAVKNYINIAKLRLGNDHYIAMLKDFDRNEDVAMLHIRQAIETTDSHTKMTLLDQAANELRSHQWWYSQIGEYQQLLRVQRELQSSSSSSEMNVRLADRSTRDAYKAAYDVDLRRHKYQRHGDRATNFRRSKELESTLKLTEEMILCARLSVITHCSVRTHYEDFVEQATKQHLFSKKYIIAPENFAEMVYNWIRLSGEGQEKASQKAETFLNMISNPGRRIYYAEKFQNYDVAMDTIANVLRDRMELEHLRRRIPKDHPSYERATALLESAKWKN